MRNILVTGGTVFVSKFIAQYFSQLGDQVYVLNRGTRPQVDGVTLIKADRHKLSDTLKTYEFDVVLDITAYNKGDVKALIDALGTIKQYIFISSSAVYPETLPQPLDEIQKCGANRIWGSYGIGKLEAEEYLLAHVPQAYVIRPPYLYGPMQNVYREPFVFDCAIAKRPFYCPKHGTLPLQFYHVEDLCRFIDVLLDKQPKEHVFNVGNEELVTIQEWVRLCYEVVESPLKMIYVDNSHSQRDYFPFYDYEYSLDVSRQKALLLGTKSLKEGLQESYEWYQSHKEEVRRKPFFEYIDTVLR